MKHLSAFRVALLSLCLLASAGAVHAQMFRTYLSIEGSDANPCTIVAPCRLLPAALAAVAPGGEVWMLDSGNFNAGMVDVNKSVTILAVPGAVGSLVANVQPALSITTPGVKVALRNLVVVPLATSPGDTGLRMIDGDSLAVEGCVFANFVSTGLHVSGLQTVSIVDTQFRSIGGTAVNAANGPTVTVTRSSFARTGDGVMAHTFVTGRKTTIDVLDSTFNGGGRAVTALTATDASTASRVTVRGSVVSGFSYGVSASAPVGRAYAAVTHSTISANGTGVRAGGQLGAVSLSNNQFTNNETALFIDGGVIETGGGNILFRNTVATAGGALTPVPAV